FLGVDPNGYPSSAFDDVHNSFEASRGRAAQWLLRRRGVRVWSRRLVPQTLRVAFRKRFLVKKGEKPKIDVDIRRMLAERFAPDLQRLEALLERDLGALRESS